MAPKIFSSHWHIQCLEFPSWFKCQMFIHVLLNASDKINKLTWYWSGYFVFVIINCMLERSTGTTNSVTISLHANSSNCWFTKSDASRPFHRAMFSHRDQRYESESERLEFERRSRLFCVTWLPWGICIEHILVEFVILYGKATVKKTTHNVLLRCTRRSLLALFQTICSKSFGPALSNL